MKLKIPLSRIKKNLVIRLPKSVLEEKEPLKVSLNKIIENKMRFLLNTIYSICTDDVKEQEKRRQIIRLYTKESNELIKILTLLLAAKYGSKIDHLESKILKLQKYNRDQEELADQLVYKCNDLKLAVSSSYDITRSIDVLLRAEVNFPTEVLTLSKALTKEDVVETDFKRVDQIVELHIQRSGIWRDEHVSYTVNKGVVELDSYGFRSTLIMTKNGKEYTWHVLSIKQIEGDGKQIPIRSIEFTNTIKELVNMTKYTASVLEVEEIYKIFKSKIENKLFDMELSGTSKEFIVVILGTYKAHIGISSNWDGPGIVCHLHYPNRSMVFKTEILVNIFTNINRSLKEEITENTSISIEKGLFYKDQPLFILRELHKEASLEKTEQKGAIFGVILKEHVNVMCAGSVIQLNIIVRANTDLFIGLSWDTEKTAIRMFYGVFQVGSLLSATEIIIKYLSVEQTLQHGPSAVNENTERSREPLTAETFYTPKETIDAVLQRPTILLGAVSSYDRVRSIKRVNAKLYIKDYVELILFGSITVKLEASHCPRVHTTITSSKVVMQDHLRITEIEKIVWLSVVIEGIISNEHILLPELYKKAIITGRLTNIDSGQIEAISFSRGQLEFTFLYDNGKIRCTSEHPLVSAWATSIIDSKSRRGLSNLFAYEDILMFPGLVSTLCLHNTLGGSLIKTCNSSILYSIKKYIEVYWSNASEKITKAFKEIPKVKEAETHAAFSLEYLQVFLQKISQLFSVERIAQFGTLIEVRANTFSLVYKLSLSENMIDATCIEGSDIKNILIILKRGPDPKRMLLDQNIRILPK